MKLGLFVIAVGIGATAIMDLWGILRERFFAIPQINYGLVGRWILYMPKGRFQHAPITATASVQGETILGWVAHYIIGVIFAGLLFIICGTEWMNNPKVLPALVFGIVTVVAPFFIMQPGLGLGIAASKTPKPNLARAHSVITHTVFGLGLYLTVRLLNLVFLNH